MPSSDTEDNFGVSDETSVKLRPRRCIVCGVVSQVVYGPDGKIIRVKEEIDVDSDSSTSFKELGKCGKPGKNLEWEISLYETFMRALKLHLKSAKYQWNFDEEPVPFCDSCEDQLSTLKDILIRLEKLEKLLACTVNELKEKMTLAEEKFQRDNVYQYDERYYWVRSGVIGKRNVGYFPRINKIRSRKVLEKAMPSTLTREPLRRSCRQSSQIMLLSSQLESENPTDNLPEESHPIKVEVEEGASPHFVTDTETESSFSVEKPALTKTRIKSTKRRPAKSKEIKNVRKRKKKKEEFGRKSLNISPPTLEEGDWEGLDLLDENPQSPPEPKLLSRQRRKIKKKAEEEYKPDSDLSESEDDQNQDEDDHNQGENKSESEEDVDDPCPESVLSGRLKVKGVRFLQNTGQVAYRDILFDPVLGGEESGESKSDSKKKFKCTKCDRVVKTQFQVKRHSKKYHLGEFSCPYSGCGYRSGFKCSLTRHVQRFHLSEHAKMKLERSECDICGKPIKRRQHIQSHRLSHYSAAEKKEAEMKGEIPPWILRFIEREPSQCEICGKVFQDAKSVKNHKRYAHTQKPEEEQQSTNKTSPKERSLMCQVCGKTFSNASSLLTHTGRQHPNTDEAISLQYCCIFCNMRFINQTKLLEHKSIHTGNRPFHCNYPNCPRQFITKLQLTKHLKVHSNVRPFLCTHCSMGFMSNHHLQRHFANYHAPGSNPKRKSFIRGPAQTPFRVMNKWKNLYLGESQQTEVRRRKCPYPNCPAAFQYPSQVKRHIVSFHSQQELVSGSEETPRPVSTQNDNVQEKFARGEEEVSDMEVDWSQSQSSSMIAQDQDTHYASPGSSDHQDLISPVPENLTVRTTFYI